MTLSELATSVATEPTAIKKVVTESAAVLELWEPGFGDLIVVTMPDGTTRADCERIGGFLQQWWGACSAHYKGAKLLVLNTGFDLKVEREEGLRQLGYVRATPPVCEDCGGTKEIESEAGTFPCGKCCNHV